MSVAVRLVDGFEQGVRLREVGLVILAITAAVVATELGVTQAASTAGQVVEVLVVAVSVSVGVAVAVPVVVAVVAVAVAVVAGVVVVLLQLWLLVLERLAPVPLLKRKLTP